MNVSSEKPRLVRSRGRTLIGVSLLALAFGILPGGWFVNLRSMYLSYGCPFPFVDYYLDTPWETVFQWRNWYMLPLDWLAWIMVFGAGLFVGLALSERTGWSVQPRMVYTVLAPLGLLLYAYLYRQVWTVFITVYCSELA